MTARTVAVVTGAGSPTGIGFATARVLARAGHCVLIVSTTDRIKDRAAELRAAGHEAHAIVADLTSEPDVERLHEHAEALGDVSVLVNNAGMAVLGEMDAPGNLERLDLGDWQRSLERNLTSAFLGDARVPARHEGSWLWPHRERRVDDRSRVRRCW